MTRIDIDPDGHTLHSGALAARTVDETRQHVLADHTRVVHEPSEYRRGDPGVRVGQ